MRILWKESDGGEVFVVEKAGEQLLEMQAGDRDLKCLIGEEYLVPDPYEEGAQQSSP